MTTKKGRGRPEYVPTDEDREKVQILRAQGMSKEAIASAVGIHHETLTKYFSVDMEVAVAKRTAEVMMARYRAAIGGNVSAQNKFLELAGALPPKATRSMKTPAKGKKEVQAEEAAVGAAGTAWGDILQ